MPSPATVAADALPRRLKPHEELARIRARCSATGDWPNLLDQARRWWPAPEGDGGMDWPGCARMAHARYSADIKLDERDREALRRQGLHNDEGAALEDDANISLNPTTTADQAGGLRGS